MTVEERDDALRGICANPSDRTISARLGRSQSVITREIIRNGGRDSYRVHAAQERYKTLKSRRKSGNWRSNERLHDAVTEKLRNDFSPERISGRLKEDYPGDAYVPRDDPSSAVPAGERGAADTAEAGPAERPGPAGTVRSTRPKQTKGRRHGQHQRASGRGAVPSSADPLGGGSDHREKRGKRWGSKLRQRCWRRR
ncbi:MAG: helix-turn-helix domain-containing protein [Pseudonocardiaceae bacterium]